MRTFILIFTLLALFNSLTLLNYFGSEKEVYTVKASSNKAFEEMQNGGDAMAMNEISFNK